MNDLISRKGAIEVLKAMAVPRHLDSACEDIYERDRTIDNAINEIRILPSAQPEISLHESCTDCPLYEKDRHRCPRFNKVIPKTLRELQSTQPGIEKLTCSKCKWEFEPGAVECETCIRIMTDNYEEAKKELTFSERQKIVRKFEEWCSSNDVVNCAESFLAYLIVEGYIDG